MASYIFWTGLYILLISGEANNQIFLQRPQFNKIKQINMLFYTINLIKHIFLSKYLKTKYKKTGLKVNVDRKLRQTPGRRHGQFVLLQLSVHHQRVHIVSSRDVNVSSHGLL